MSDVYHSGQNTEKSQIIYTNVADIKLIPESSEVKIGDIKVKLRSQTMNTVRRFQPKNSATVRTLHSLLLSMFLFEFATIIKNDSTLPMINNLYQFLPSICPCKSPKCTKLSNLSAPYTKQFRLNKYFTRSRVYILTYSPGGGGATFGCLGHKDFVLEYTPIYQVG